MEIIYSKFDSREALYEEVARDLASGIILGWFQGGSEFGPRALGFRSIFADARNPDIKDILNQEIKNREYWRPYAPIVLAEYADQWFDMANSAVDGYMLMNAKVLKDDIPGVTHIDGTARVQTVTPELNLPAYSLLQEFYKQTGVPVLVNTSFNLGGEPIIESPTDALTTLKNSNLQALCMEDYYFKKQE